MIMNNFITISDIHEKMSLLVKYAQSKQMKGFVLTVAVRPHQAIVNVNIRFKTEYSFTYNYDYETFMNMPLSDIYDNVMEDFIYRIKNIDSWNAGGV